MLILINHMDKDRFIQRSLEILPGLFSWTVITMPLWLSFWYPVAVAYFVILFDVYWFYRSAQLALNSVLGYLRLKAHLKVDWLNEVKGIKNPPLNYKDLKHVVIVPSYKEPIETLHKTLECLCMQTFPTKQIYIVLATEERDPQGPTVSAELQAQYKDVFGDIWITVHPEISGEVKGKSSNMAWAGKFVKGKIHQMRIDLDTVTVTSCDADSQLPEQYFAYLSYKFLTDPDRYYHFYQAAIMFYSNIWRVPLPIRVINTIGSILNLASLMRPDKLVNLSTYSLSFRLCQEVGYWAVDVIPEDWHLFFKAFFNKGEKVSVVPIFLPIYADAAESTTYFKTIINQYEQIKRWAWGVTDTSYVIKQWFIHPEIPFFSRTIRVLRAVEFHFLWSVNWFILTLGATLPPLINPAFASTVLGRNLPIVSGNILSICSLCLLVIIIVDYKARPPLPANFQRRYIPLLYLQWLTIPIVGFFLSALPGLDAHTRLMLGKYLEYRVTEKVAKNE
jgi:cellulose synthase/poly-beta-1,6-N-acetylglucosamine synthase-like glycosyltransferase